MGSSFTRISEDENFYTFLCEKYNEKPLKLYSNHYKWLEDRYHEKTSLSYETYNIGLEVIRIKQEIESKEHKINFIQEEIENLKTELVKLIS